MSDSDSDCIILSGDNIPAQPQLLVIDCSNDDDEPVKPEPVELEERKPVIEPLPVKFEKREPVIEPLPVKLEPLPVKLEKREPLPVVVAVAIEPKPVIEREPVIEAGLQEQLSDTDLAGSSSKQTAKKAKLPGARHVRDRPGMYAHNWEKRYNNWCFEHGYELDWVYTKIGEGFEAYYEIVSKENMDGFEPRAGAPMRTVHWAFIETNEFGVETALKDPRHLPGAFPPRKYVIDMPDIPGAAPPQVNMRTTYVKLHAVFEYLHKWAGGEVPDRRRRERPAARKRQLYSEDDDGDGYETPGADVDRVGCVAPVQSLEHGAAACDTESEGEDE